MHGRGPAEQAQQYQQMIQKNDRTTSSIPCNSSRVPGRFLVVNAGRHELWLWVVSNFYLQDGLMVMGLGVELFHREEDILGKYMCMCVNDD